VLLRWRGGGLGRRCAGPRRRGVGEGPVEDRRLRLQGEEVARRRGGEAAGAAGLGVGRLASARPGAAGLGAAWRQEVKWAGPARGEGWS
jgi:hypothetical protein